MNERDLRLQDAAIYSDHRYIESLKPQRLKDFKEKGMTAKLVLTSPSERFFRMHYGKEVGKEAYENWLEEGEPELEIPVHVVYEVCSTCEGKATVVNPAIDAHGISAEEFDQDPDFAYQYFSGVFDKACPKCAGRRVVPIPCQGRTPAHVMAAWRRQKEEDLKDAQQQAWENKMGW